MLRAGLWEKPVKLVSYGNIDFETILQMAQEQSVVGLIAAGLEHVEDSKPSRNEALQFIGIALQLEQQNTAMNAYIGLLIEKLRKADIYALLIKGQGVAQCYERPLWRACGDVDLFLSDDNYEKAKHILVPVASHVESEYVFKKHLGLTIDSWQIELHGYLRRGLSRRINNVLDDIKEETFSGGEVSSWMNGKTQVFLLGVENHIIYVFIHYLSHFYGGGIGLRQICDWVRLLWTYRDVINRKKIENRLKKMGVVYEWKAFGAFAVDYLGMLPEAVPFYSSDAKWKRKADMICYFIMKVGNFGHNRNNSYYNKPFLIRKVISFVRRCGDVVQHTRIFPIESLRFFPYMMLNGLRAALKDKE